MRLLLIRHADAGDRDDTLWPDDTERPLSERGRKRQARVAKRLRRQDLVPDLLLSSPWLRAWQTSGLTADIVRCDPPVACAALATAPVLTAIDTAIGPTTGDRLVALVGHEPWLGELASQLLVGDTRLQVDFAKSAVLGLHVERLTPGSATLEFFWRPKAR
ncbi:MAG: histidine phosphatase family protein [Gemmatimonadales bacterium]